MTRKDLAEKKIDKMESMEQALELISILDYEECIMTLKKLDKIPYIMYKALIDRAKSLKGNTLELIVSSMQSVVNC